MNTTTNLQLSNYNDLSLEQMLMYGKEASNRKQEIDRQHYTIPNQRPKDKHCFLVSHWKGFLNAKWC